MFVLFSFFAPSFLSSLFSFSLSSISLVSRDRNDDLFSCSSFSHCLCHFLLLLLPYGFSTFLLFFFLLLFVFLFSGSPFSTRLGFYSLVLSLSMAGHQTSMFVAVVVGRLNLRRYRISLFSRWLASLGTGFVADRLSIGRVCFVVVSQPKLGHISAITWPCLGLLSAAARPSHGHLFGVSRSHPSAALLAASRLFLGSLLADSRFLSRLSADVDGSRPSHGSHSAMSIRPLPLSSSLSGPCLGHISAGWPSIAPVRPLLSHLP